MQTTSLFALGAVLAAAALVPLATAYIRNASRLTAWIDAQCPELWDKVWQASWTAARRPLSGQIFYNRPQRLDGIVFFNRATDAYPNDPEFRSLLSSCRWLAYWCFIAFTAAILLLGGATAR